nr:hypothetical protein [Tanacetum cinerariifolium]
MPVHHWSTVVNGDQQPVNDAKPPVNDGEPRRKEMIRYKSEVEEAVRMISSTYSSKLAFTILTLECVTIGCCEMGSGGGGGVVGGVGVICGDGVDSGVGGQGTGIRDDCKDTRER